MLKMSAFPANQFYGELASTGPQNPLPSPQSSREISFPPATKIFHLFGELSEIRDLYESTA
jgi:hypothetical protein